MESINQSKPLSFLAKIFEPSVDFYALLNQQAAKTIEGMQALADWLNTENGDERCQVVRDLERQADLLKFELARKLQDSFITPFDREDIYEISTHLDDVINSAKAIVREIEAFGLHPIARHYICDMTAILIGGTECLCKSIANLKNNLHEASQQAMLVRKVEKHLTKVYRLAMQELLQQDDIKEIMRANEVYRSMWLAADRIEVMGEKLMHAIVKMG